jgi:hypothetical protein
MMKKPPEVQKVHGVPIDKIPFGIQLLVRKISKSDITKRVNGSAVKEHVQIKEGPQGTILLSGRMLDEVRAFIQAIAIEDATAQRTAAGG